MPMNLAKEGTRCLHGVMSEQREIHQVPSAAPDAVKAGMSPDAPPCEVSYAEWRWEFMQAERAMDDGDVERAVRGYGVAGAIAERFLRLADRNRFTASCAVRAFLEAKRGLAKALRAQDRKDDALAIANSAFTQICLRAAWPCTAPQLRDACEARISDALDDMSSALDRAFAAPAKHLAARAIAEQSRRQANALRRAA